MDRGWVARMAIDIDGVLADLLHDFLPLMNARFDCELRPEDITRYAFEDVARVPAEEMSSFMAGLADTDFYRRLLPLPGVPQALRCLQDRYHLHLVTSRPARLKDQTLAWLAEHGIPYHRLSFRRRPHKVFPEDAVDVVVEDDRDAAAHAAQFASRVFLLDYPYNRQGVELPDHCLRVRDWNEIVTLLVAL